jgi:hypothetical protein
MLSLVVALAAVTALGACDNKTTEETAVRAALGKLAKATASHDYRALCDDLLAPALVRQIETAAVPCRDALRAGLGTVKRPRLTVRSVQVRKSRATARVHTSATGQKPSDDTVTLVKVDGEWRVASLASPRGR